MLDVESVKKLLVKLGSYKTFMLQKKKKENVMERYYVLNNF